MYKMFSLVPSKKPVTKKIGNFFTKENEFECNDSKAVFVLQWNLDLRKPDLRKNLDLRKIF